MNENSRNRHMIDFLFTIAPMFVFAIAAVCVTIFASKNYANMVDNSSRSNAAQTAVAYISEKVHQNDKDSQIYIGELDGQDALIINQTYNGKEYNIFIYEYDGKLCELFADAGFAAEAQLGSRIVDIDSFELEQIDDNLFNISCTGKDGRKANTYVAVRSD